CLEGGHLVDARPRDRERLLLARAVGWVAHEVDAAVALDARVDGSLLGGGGGRAKPGDGHGRGDDERTRVRAHRYLLPTPSHPPGIAFCHLTAVAGKSLRATTSPAGPPSRPAPRPACSARCCRGGAPGSSAWPRGAATAGRGAASAAGPSPAPGRLGR